MSASQQFKAVGGSSEVITRRQEAVADHIVSVANLPEDVKAQVREILLGKHVRHIVAQCLLGTYVQGLEVGRGRR